jgi:hypothetical protein
MPRSRQRAQLESGLKLDINRLLRRGFIRSGTVTGPIGIAGHPTMSVVRNLWGAASCCLYWPLHIALKLGKYG